MSDDEFREEEREFDPNSLKTAAFIDDIEDEEVPTIDDLEEIEREEEDEDDWTGDFDQE